MHLKAGHGFGKQANNGQVWFLSRCLVRAQPLLTLFCVDRTFNTAGCASVVAGAEWRVAELIPAPADVMEVAGHQVALMPSLPDQPWPPPTPPHEGCCKTLLGSPVLACYFRGLLPED